MDGEPVFALYNAKTSLLEGLLCLPHPGWRPNLILDADANGKMETSEMALVSYDGKEGRLHYLQGDPVTKCDRSRCAIIQGDGCIITDARRIVHSSVMRHEGSVQAVVALDAGRIATGSQDGVVKLWNLISLNRPRVKLLQAVAPKKDLLVAAKDGPVILRSADGQWTLQHKGNSGTTLLNNSNRQTTKILGFPDMGSTNSFCINRPATLGAMLGRAHISGENFQEGAYVFELPKGDASYQFLPHANCDSSTFSDDGKSLATFGNDQILLWDTGTWQRHQSAIAQHQVHTGAFVNHDRMLLSASSTGRLVLWDVQKLQKLAEFNPDKSWGLAENDSHTDSTWGCLAMSGDSSIVAAAFGSYVVLWDVASEQPLCDPLFVEQPVLQLSFVDGDRFALHIRRSDGSVVVWTFDPVGRDFTLPEIKWLDTSIDSLSTQRVPAGLDKLPDNSSPWLIELGESLNTQLETIWKASPAKAVADDANRAFVRPKPMEE
jgi:WD40 repeat protein